MKLNWFVSVAILFCVFGSLKGVDWSEPEKVISPGHFFTLSVDNYGRLWMYGGIWKVTYFDEGWQEPMEVELDAVMGNTFRMCIDKEDAVWVSGGNSWEIYYRCYDGDSWSEIDSVPTYPSLADFAKITADSSGGVWVGWTTDWWGWLDGAYNRYRNGSWDEPQVLTDTLERADHVIQAMTTDVYGRVWIVWLNHYELHHEPFESLESVYYDDGWSEEILISSSNKDEGSFPGLFPYTLDLAPDEAGGVWALWDFFCFYKNINFIHSSYWNGEGWSLVDTIAQAGDFFNEIPPSVGVAVDGDGNVWAVWRQALEYNDKYGDIYYSVNTGTGWSEPAPVNEHPAVDRYPDIAVDGAGRIWCVWSSNREGEDEWDYSIWASYATGVGVKEPVTPVTHRLPSLTIDKSVGGEFTFSVSHSNIVRGIVICDASGRVVSDLTISDNQTIHWDGTDAKGQALSPGVYFVKLSPTSSTLKLILIR